MAVVKSPQNVKRPVLSNGMNSLFNPDSVHSLLGNSAINFSSTISFVMSQRFKKAQRSAENTILLMLIASGNISYDRATAVCNAILVGHKDILLSIFNNL